MIVRWFCNFKHYIDSGKLRYKQVVWVIFLRWSARITESGVRTIESCRDQQMVCPVPGGVVCRQRNLAGFLHQLYYISSDVISWSVASCGRRRGNYLRLSSHSNGNISIEFVSYLRYFEHLTMLNLVASTMWCSPVCMHFNTLPFIKALCIVFSLIPNEFMQLFFLRKFIQIFSIRKPRLNG